MDRIPVISLSNHGILLYVVELRCLSVQCIDLIEEFGNKCLKFVTKLVRTLGFGG